MTGPLWFDFLLWIQYLRMKCELQFTHGGEIGHRQAQQLYTLTTSLDRGSVGSTPTLSANS